MPHHITGEFIFVELFPHGCVVTAIIELVPGMRLYLADHQDADSDGDEHPRRVFFLSPPLGGVEGANQPSSGENVYPSSKCGLGYWALIEVRDTRPLT